jgi:hypothetical protein
LLILDRLLGTFLLWLCAFVIFFNSFLGPAALLWSRLIVSAICSGILTTGLSESSYSMRHTEHVGTDLLSLFSGSLALLSLCVMGTLLTKLVEIWVL